MTALYVASHNGHVEVVNILLQNGTNADVQEEVSFTFSHSTRAVATSPVGLDHFPGHNAQHACALMNGHAPFQSLLAVRST